MLTSSTTTKKTSSVEEPQVFRFESSNEKEYNTIPHDQEQKRDCDSNKPRDDTRGKITKKYKVFEMVKLCVTFASCQSNLIGVCLRHINLRIPSLKITKVPSEKQLIITKNQEARISNDNNQSSTQIQKGSTLPPPATVSPPVFSTLTHLEKNTRNGTVLRTMYNSDRILTHFFHSFRCNKSTSWKLKSEPWVSFFVFLTFTTDV